MPGDLQKKVLLANSLALTSFAMLLECSRASGVWLLENPADRGVFPFPSIFATPEMAELEAEVGPRAVVSISAVLDFEAPSLRT